MTEAEVRDLLRNVIDPELGINIVDLGLVRGIQTAAGTVRITMIMTTPACPLRDYIQDVVVSTVGEQLPQGQLVSVDIVEDPPWSEEMMSDAARRQLR